MTKTKIRIEEVKNEENSAVIGAVFKCYVILYT